MKKPTSKRQEIFQERLYWHKRKNDNRLKEWNIESASEIEALQELDREVERHCELTKEIAKKWNDAEEKSEILLELREFLKLYKKDPWTFPKKWGKDGSFGARNAFGNVLQGFIAQKRWPKKREIMQLMRDRRYNVTSSTFDRCLDFYDVKDVFKAEKESIKKV